MKNLQLISILLIITNIYAQSPIIPLFDYSIKDTPNAYYKDLSNIRDQFVGSYIYNNGSEQIKVRFKKINQFYRNNDNLPCYIDYLVGEIQYINSAGIEKFNSLANLNNIYTDINDYSMYSGPYLINKSAPQCMSCPIGTKRLYMFYTEPDIDDMTLKGMWAMRIKVENGVTKLLVQFEMAEGSIGISKFDYSQNAIKCEHDVPYGEYVFIKE